MLRDFIRALDDHSFDLRFDDAARDEVVPEHMNQLADKLVLALSAGGTRIIGLADHSTSTDYQNAAHVNIVVAKEHQGKGIGKQLMLERDKALADAGYEYKVGIVYSDNERQIDRLQRSGWRETTESVAEGSDFRTFWKALVPRLANTAPRSMD